MVTNMDSPKEASGRIKRKISQSGSSDDSCFEGDIKVEVFSQSGFEEVSAVPEWTPRAIEILDFINRRLIREDVNYPIFLELILTQIVQMTGSEFGNIALKDGDKLTCIALGEKSPGCLGSNPGHDKSLQSIFGHSLQSGKIVISNSVSTDPRRRTHDLPSGHPKIKSILLIPIKAQWMLSLANKKEYTASDAGRIIPLIKIFTRILKKTELCRETLLSRTVKKKVIQNKFLAAMSHDLRTPLNGILGMITLLPDAGPLTPKQKEYVTNIKECTFQMVTLVNNFLDFNKMTSDGLTLKKEPLRIEKSVKDSLAVVRGEIVNKDLELKSKVPPKLPGLMGDQGRLTQILSNLLSNAVKFTERGRVSLRVQIQELKNNSPRKWKLTFRIKDTGIGIPREEQEKIFEFFHQANSLSTFHSRSGTGFGLSFSRELVRLMGGKIWVKSKVGKGSTFTFFVVMEEEVRSQKKKKLFHKKRVLVVDDRVEIRLTLSDILFNWGCVPVVLGSATEALNFLKHDPKFDLGMIDICMPNMTGIELAQELRRRYPSIPLIGISSAELMGGEEYFDYYTYKPVDQNKLFALASKCLHKSRGAMSNKRLRSIRKKKPRRRLKILIAEDNTYNAYTLKELLLNLGFKEDNITTVSDGKACVEETKRKTYDVILMDILMPVMDGVEASVKILQEPSPPMIIAASAAVMNTDKARCQEVGISGYLEKPITKDKLEVALLPLVSRKKHKGAKRSNQDEHRGS